MLLFANPIALTPPQAAEISLFKPTRRKLYQLCHALLFNKGKKLIHSIVEKSDIFLRSLLAGYQVTVTYVVAAGMANAKKKTSAKLQSCVKIEAKMTEKAQFTRSK